MAEHPRASQDSDTHKPVSSNKPPTVTEQNDETQLTQVSLGSAKKNLLQEEEVHDLFPAFNKIQENHILKEKLPLVAIDVSNINSPRLIVLIQFK